MQESLSDKLQTLVWDKFIGTTIMRSYSNFIEVQIRPWQREISFRGGCHLEDRHICSSVHLQKSVHSTEYSTTCTLQTNSEVMTKFKFTPILNAEQIHGSKLLEQSGWLITNSAGHYDLSDFISRIQRQFIGICFKHFISHSAHTFSQTRHACLYSLELRIQKIVKFPY